MSPFSISNFFKVLSIVLLLGAPAIVSGHAAQEGSFPEHASTVSGSPQHIAVWFDHPMRLTLFRVTGPSGSVSLSPAPSRDMVRRFETVPLLPLEPGEYSVSWRGLAEDGHIMFDEFYFTVE